MTTHGKWRSSLGVFLRNEQTFPKSSTTDLSSSLLARIVLQALSYTCLWRVEWGATLEWANHHREHSFQVQQIYHPGFCWRGQKKRKKRKAMWTYVKEVNVLSSNPHRWTFPKSQHQTWLTLQTQAAAQQPKEKTWTCRHKCPITTLFRAQGQL